MNHFKNIFAAGVTLMVFATVSVAIAGNQNKPFPVNACSMQIPYGKPIADLPSSTIICRHAYVLEHDNLAKIPAWVSYVLKSEYTLGCIQRSNSFASDQSLDHTQKSKLEDYSRSGYDTGHMVPAGDMAWNEVADDESFILSNTAPQTPELNRGAWKTLESAVRSWAYNNNNELVVYAGPIYNLKENYTIGPNQVTVPHAFYKIIIDKERNQSLAFVFENDKKKSKDLSFYQTTVADIESATNIAFNVPDDKHVKNDIWTINTVLLYTAKKKKCDN